MKNKARNLILLFVFVVILATIGNLLPEEKEEASQVVSQNSIIYEHGFPQTGTAAMLVTDDSERVLELESKVAQQDEQIKLLKKHIKKLVAEQEQTDKLKELVHFIVFKRTNEFNKDDFNELRGVGYDFEFAPMNYIDVSSTRLRENLGNGISINDMELPKIREYIKEHGLYQ